VTNDLPTYQRELLLALRLRDVPGPRIAEALAEVESHVVDTGEDAYDAFGNPDEYAAELAAVHGEHSGMRGARRVRSAGARMVISTFSAVGGMLLVLGLLAIGAGDSSIPGGIAAATSAIVGAVLLGVVALVLVATVGVKGDPVRDPRTGDAMTPPFPWWAVAALIAVVPVSLLIGAIAGK